MLSDADVRQLLHGAQRRDEHALSRLYLRYADRIFRFIYYRVGERARAEELTSEVFIRVIEKIGTFKLGGEGHALALTSWIYRIAHNLVIDEYRSHEARHPTDSLTDEFSDSFEESPASELNLSRIDLEVALKHLTDDQQTVILLRFGEEMTCAQIAQVLGKPETAIKALQRRGLAALARQLGQTPTSAHATRGVK
jgi:RNA polymerase sigma-70 factor (ECF subfamily)